jgi:hypothetical protein
MRRAALVALAAALVAACSSGPPRSQASGPPRSTASSASPSPSPKPTPSASVARLASGEALPSVCTPGRPKPSNTATFVSAGHAWSLSPDGSLLTCLFDVPDPGPFDWGPLGDRALVGGFEVKGLPGALTIPSSELRSGPTSWGRPTGKSIVLVSAGGHGLEKVHLDGKPIQDITPLPGARYLGVTYHPSGLAIAFAVQRGGGESIWISSNTGTKARRLVFSREGTKFGALAFGADGIVLYYAAVHANGTSVLHELSLENPTEAGALASAPPGRRILEVMPGPEASSIAWTAGRSCEDTVATVRDAEGNKLTIPGGSRPTRVLGWLDAERILVATGGCSDPVDLSAVEVSTGTAVPLVFGVDAAGVRTAAPTPPPPLPQTDADVGSGNA